VRRTRHDLRLSHPLAADSIAGDSAADSEFAGTAIAAVTTEIAGTARAAVAADSIAGDSAADSEFAAAAFVTGAAEIAAMPLLTSPC
jgi:hypothetical protein